MMLIQLTVTSSRHNNDSQGAYFIGKAAFVNENSARIKQFYLDNKSGIKGAA